MGPCVWNILSNNLKILNTTLSFTHNNKLVLSIYSKNLSKRNIVLIISLLVTIVINRIIIAIIFFYLYYYYYCLKNFNCYHYYYSNSFPLLGKVTVATLTKTKPYQIFTRFIPVICDLRIFLFMDF